MRQAAPFADQLDALGIWWPRGDGDAMRAAARSWAAIADVIGEITASLDDVQVSVSAGYRGPAADALADLWAAWSGPDGHLPATADDCRRLSAALTDFGGDIDLAHSTLVAFLEAVLGTDGGIVDGDDIALLRTEADEIGAVLSKRAAVRGRPLTAIGAVHTRVPADRSAVDPARVTWVDPGTPDDLTFLVGESVDLGAGQGAVDDLLPGLLPGLGPGPGPGTPPGGPCATPGCDHSSCESIPLTPCPTCGCLGCVCGGGGRPVGPPIACPAPGPADDGGPADGDELDGARPDDVVDVGAPITLEPPLDAAGTGGGDLGAGGGFGGGLGGGLGGGGFGGGGGFDLGGAFDALPDGAIAAAPLAAAAAVPISVARPPTSTPPPMTPPTATPGAAHGSSSGSRMPFLPMMPMSGGAGEDGTEPKRRRVRKPRWPTAD